MRQNLISVSAAGLKAHRALLEPFRVHADELATAGIEYEEQDLRADPLSMSLLVTVVVTASVSTAVGELIKKVLASLSEKAATKSDTTVINIKINGTTLVLPADSVRVADKIDALAAR